MERKIEEVLLLIECLEKKKIDLGLFEWAMWELPRAYIDKFPSHIRESVDDVLEEKEYGFETMLTNAYLLKIKPTVNQYMSIIPMMEILLSKSWLILTMIVDIVLYFENSPEDKSVDYGYWDFFLTTMMGVNVMGYILKEDAYEIRRMCDRRKLLRS